MDELLVNGSTANDAAGSAVLTLDHLRAAIRLLRGDGRREPVTFVPPRWMQAYPDELRAFRTRGHAHACPLPFEEIILPDGTRAPFWLESEA